VRGKVKVTSDDRLAVIEERMRALEAEAAALRRFPDDDFAEGTVIRFELRVDGREGAGVCNFTYAALKVIDMWWITGQWLPGEAHTRQSRAGITYGKLRQILAKAENVRLFTGDGEPLARDERERERKLTDGDVTVIGPECFASLDEEVISWRGRNYVPQPPRSEGADAGLRDLAGNPAGLPREATRSTSEDEPKAHVETAEPGRGKFFAGWDAEPRG
jgi:hypothetical protein